MSTMASQITSLTIVYSTVYSRRKWKKTSKVGVTGPCAENSPVTGEFPAQMASDAENVSICWRHREFALFAQFNHTTDLHVRWHLPIEWGDIACVSSSSNISCLLWLRKTDQSCKHNTGIMLISFKTPVKYRPRCWEIDLGVFHMVQNSYM